MGRKPTYDSEKVAEEVIEWVSDGRTLRDYCRQPGNPSFRVVYDYLEADKDFATRFARARETGHDVIAEDALQIAESAPLEVFDDLGNKRYDPGSIAHKKLIIETRLKLLAKWNPKKWGERTTVAGDAEAPVAMAVDFGIFNELLQNIALKRQADE